MNDISEEVKEKFNDTKDTFNKSSKVAKIVMMKMYINIL